MKKENKKNAILKFTNKSTNQTKTWKKIYKKMKKQLIKFAKDFKCWDYEYLEKVLFQMIKMFKLFYVDYACNLFQDTSDTCDGIYYKFADVRSSLNKCLTLIQELEEHGSRFDESDIRKALYTTIGDYIEGWWD